MKPTIQQCTRVNTAWSQMNENIAIRIYSSFSGELEEKWKRLEEQYAWSPFLTFRWLSHWQAIVGEPALGMKLQIVVLTHKDVVTGILPLGVRKIKGVTVLEWLGGIHADYMGPLLHADYLIPATEFTALWHQISAQIAKHDVVYLRRQPGKLETVINPFVAFLPAKHNETSFQTTLNGSWDEFCKTRFKKKIQLDSRRQRLRVQELGILRFVIADSAETAGTIIDKMIAYKRQRYLAMGVTDYLASEKHRQFYLQLPEGLKKGIAKLHCAALTVDDQIIATHVGMVMNDTFYYLMPANDGEIWQRYSAGRLLLENLLEWAFHNGLKVFDFTIGAEDYKKNWCDSERLLYDYFKPANLKGKAYGKYINLIQKLSKVAFFKKIRKKWLSRSTKQSKA